MEFSGYPAEFATRVAAVLGAGLEASIAVSHHGAMVRAGSSSPRRFSRDTEERTEGASTPSTPSSLISSATGSGASSGVRPYAPYRETIRERGVCCSATRSL